MALKESFANVLRAIRSKRNLTQRQLGDVASRTYLSKLEAGKSSITIDKLDQLSGHLNLSPLTLLTLTISEQTGQSAGSLVLKLRDELQEILFDGELDGLALPGNEALAMPALLRAYRKPLVDRSAGTVGSPGQTELFFSENESSQA